MHPCQHLHAHTCSSRATSQKFPVPNFLFFAVESLTSCLRTVKLCLQIRASFSLIFAYSSQLFCLLTLFFSLSLSDSVNDITKLLSLLTQELSLVHFHGHRIIILLLLLHKMQTPQKLFLFLFSFLLCAFQSHLSSKTEATHYFHSQMKTKRTDTCFIFLKQHLCFSRYCTFRLCRLLLPLFSKREVDPPTNLI